MKIRIDSAAAPRAQNQRHSEQLTVDFLLVGAKHLHLLHSTNIKQLDLAQREDEMADVGG